MASLQHVSQRVPGVVRDLARGHLSAVNPDSERLRSGGLGCLSRGHGEDSRVSRQVGDDLNVAPLKRPVAAQLDFQETGPVPLELSLEITARLEDSFLERPGALPVGAATHRFSATDSAVSARAAIT